MYNQGQGVPQDYALAVEWFRKAAKQGNAVAQSALGAAYDQGQGVPQDYAQAAVWYRKAAKQGTPSRRTPSARCALIILKQHVQPFSQTR